MFGDQPRRPAPPPRPQAASGRSRALVITAVVLAGLFVLLTALSSVYTERLWFDAVGYLGVFSTVLWTRVGLFLVFGALMAIVVGVNMAVAFKTRPLFRPPSPEQGNLDRYREAVLPIRTWLLVGVAVVMGIFAGTSATGQWRSYLLWRNGVDFGTTDPYFDRDVGFYVFELPWWHYLVDFTMAAAVIGAMAAAVVHYLFGGIRLQGRDRLTGAAQVQLSVLVGLFVLAKAVDYWLDRFDLLNDAGGLITGITYTDDNAVLPAKNILAGIAVICALLFFLNVWRRTWILPSMGLAMLALSAVLLGAVWPGVVQQFQVDPTEADKEEPYIQRNIDATRAAYDLEDSEVVPYTAGGVEVSAAEDEIVAQQAIESSGVRLVDPNIIPAAFEQSQQIRGYYSVADVLDVDQYDVEGTPRDLVLGVRELNQAGIAETSQNWANLHTVYTHGDGVIAAFGNQRPADNSAQTASGNEEPRWANPPLGDLTDIVGEYESRIYYGENAPAYSVVGKREADDPDLELDLPISVGGEETEESEATSTYDGEVGVDIGSLFRKVLYAVRFGEPNLVLSDRVHENSRILYDRDPALMVEKVAPWLTVDADPFPAVVDGKVLWILDGYTLSDQYPLSERESFDEMTDDALDDGSAFQTLPTDEINYIRNSVKATVDAYDGTVTLYAWDESDPMLEAWMNAFPGTVQAKDQIPDAVLEHMRYPEDLFKVQRFQLARYHVTDAADFYQGNERWEVPTDPNQQALQPPYRLSVERDGANRFSLTSTFVPVNRENLAAYMTVDAEANSETYGTLRVLDLAAGGGRQVSGPGQVASRINADEDLQDALLRFTAGSESRAVYGNLLTIPVDDRLLYVQPIYTIRQTGDGSFPVLQYTAVSFGEDVGFGATYADAVRDLLGIEEGGVQTPSPEPPAGEGDPGEGQVPNQPEPGAEATVAELLRQADGLYDQAQDALRQGDLAEYQRLNDQAAALVNRALAAADAEAGGGAGQESGR
nr:UPF0182 family protein [Nocardioides perillae]